MKCLSDRGKCSKVATDSPKVGVAGSIPVPSAEIKPDPAVKERHEKWKANLPEKEQQDFDYVFGK